MKHILQMLVNYFDLSYSDTFNVELSQELKEPLTRLMVDTYAENREVVVERALDFYARHIKENGVSLVPTSYVSFLRDEY